MYTWWFTYESKDLSYDTMHNKDDFKVLSPVLHQSFFSSPKPNGNSKSKCDLNHRFWMRLYGRWSVAAVPLVGEYSNSTFLLTVGSLNGPSYSFTACNINSRSTYPYWRVGKDPNNWRHTSLSEFWRSFYGHSSCYVLSHPAPISPQSVTSHESRTVRSLDPSPPQKNRILCPSMRWPPYLFLASCIIQ